MTASRRALIVVGVLVAVALGLPWGGAVPTASAQTIFVTAADPPTGEQGTLNLNVLIKGKGFKNGAKAKFYKTGTTDPAGVNVKTTQFVSSTQLIANIDIDDEAALDLFDIEVRTADGRTGKGTELFSVVQKGNGNVTPPPSVTVAVTLNYGDGNKIRAEGDPNSPYVGYINPLLRAGTTDTYDYFLSFWFRYDSLGLDAKRSVVFDFGLPRYAIGAKLNCYPTEDFTKDRARVPYLFTVPTFLTAGRTEGSEKPRWMTIQTSYEWKKVNGTWQSTGQYLDLRPYLASQLQAGPRCVEFYIDFRTVQLAKQGTYAFIAHNGPIKSPGPWGSTRGLAEVTPAAYGGFVLKPVSAEDLAASLPSIWLYPWLGLPYETLSDPSTASQANQTITVPSGGQNGFRAVRGICDVGTFDMPFIMTVKWSLAGRIGVRSCVPTRRTV